MEYMVENYQFFVGPITVLIYWFCRILFFIVRRFDKYLTIIVYCNIPEDKVKLIDSSNAIKDNYKDDPIMIGGLVDKVLPKTG